MLRNLLLFSFVVFINLYAFSQYKNIDSLKVRLPVTTGKDKADVLVNLARSTYKKDPAAAQKYLDELEPLIKSLNYEQGLINYKILTGRIEFNKKNYESALSKFKEAKDKAVTIKNVKLIAEAYSLMGAVYPEINKEPEISLLLSELEKYPKVKDVSEAIAKINISRAGYFYKKNNIPASKEWFQKALSIYVQINNDKQIAGIGMNIGIMEYRLGEIKQSLKTYETSIIAANRLHDTLLIADCLTNISLSEYSLGNIDKSINTQKEANELYLKIHNSKAYQSGLVNLSSSLSKTGKQDEALKYLLSSLEYAKKTGDDKGIVICYSSLASVSFDNYDTLRAIKYMKDGLALSQEKKFVQYEARFLKSLGSTQTFKGNYEEALNYLYKSEALYVSFNNPADMAGIYISLGNAYLKKKDAVKAEEYYTKALEIARTTGSKEEVAGLLSNIGVINFDQKKYDKSIELYEQALSIRKEINDPYDIADSYLTLSNSYYEKKNYEKSYDYYKQYHVLLDSVSKLSSKEEMAEMQTKYDTKEKEQQIGMLSKEQQVKTLLLAKNTKELLNQQLLNEGKLKEIDLLNKDKIINENDLKVSKMAESEKQKELEIANKDKLINEKEANRQKQVRYIFTGGFIVAIILALFILRSYVQKRKDNTLISHQKKEVEHQNELIRDQKKEITDSINYAQRIQKAILPHTNDIKIREHFILYKPKDIVSGDFYFYKQTQTGYIVAVADCTGHGVPGAFMSLIGSKELKEITEHTAEPGKILSKLNVAVKNTLKQNREDATRDGMDIILIHVTDNKVVFSGANRPLWYVEKSTGLLKEVKATKHAIGGLTENDQVFEQQELILEKGDMMYLSSDGFADQFGGEKGKKLTTKKMKDELQTIFNDSMAQQEIYLNTMFETWRGNLEQLDDICVIGIRI